MSDVVLQIAGLLISFVLRLALFYLLCLGVARLCHSPRYRFALWLAFLGTSVAYWCALCWEAAGVWRDAGAGSSAHAWAAGGVSGGMRALLLPASWHALVRVSGWLAPAAYLLGVLWLAGWVAWKHATLRRSLRPAVLPSPALERIFRRTCSLLGIQCELLIVPGLSSPATAFWWRPRVLLPEACNSPRPEASVTDALRHELVHVARRDYLWAVLADLAHCLLFFHPVVWYARAQLRIERELACDAAVVRACPHRRADYAESLTRFARLRLMHCNGLLGVDFVPSASLLQRRVRNVLAEAPRPSKWALGLRAAAAFLLLVLVAPAWHLFAVTVGFVPTRTREPAVRAQQSYSLPESAPVTRRAHLARRTVLGFRAAANWQQARLAAAPPPSLGVPSSLPAFVSVPDSNGPEFNDSADPESPVAGTALSFTASEQAWSEAAPYARKRSAVVGAVAARALGAIGIIGLDRNSRTIRGRGHWRISPRGRESTISIGDRQPIGVVSDR